MAEELAVHFRSEIERLNAELSKVRKEAQALRADRNGKVKTAETQLQEAHAELEKLKGENLKLAKKIETIPGELQGELEKLKGEIRTRDHKGKFNEIAQELKADPKALDALWKLSEYNPDSDEVDVEKIKGVISETLEKNPFMRAAGEAPRQPLFQPGPGAGKGGKASNPAGSFTMSYEQGRDPQFTRMNRQVIAEAAKNGLLVVTGGPDI